MYWATWNFTIGKACTEFCWETIAWKIEKRINNIKMAARKTDLSYGDGEWI
jgi:hypothetical protein